MHFDSKLYQEYLTELQSLENFRSSHSNLHYDTPIEQAEDPDTKRLVEALAFFSARTRVHAVNTVTQLHEKLFRQYFPYLLSPLPAMAMVRFIPSLRCTEKTLIPAGTALQFKTLENKSATFQTLTDVTILPLFYELFEMKTDEGGRSTFSLHFETPHHQIETLDDLSIYVNHLNSYAAANEVFYTLLHAIEEVTIVYDRAEKERLNCIVSSGSTETSDVFAHPVEKIRSRLHLPQQDLFLRIQLPPYRKKWKSFVLTFKLGSNWNKSLKLTKETFELFVIPTANLKKESMDPIRHNGTKDCYPLLHPSPEHDFKLHSILKVSELLKNGSNTLIPSFLGQKKDAYEINFSDQTISLEMPNAFIEPKSVVVDALWTQSWFSSHLGEEINVDFGKESLVSGVSVQVVGNIQKHEESYTQKKPFILLQVLALKNQNRLVLSEILLLINLLKDMKSSRFNKVIDKIRTVEVNQQLDKHGLGLSMEYRFELNHLENQSWTIFVIFFKYLSSFLNGWLSNFNVETKVLFPHTKKPLIFRGDKDNDLSILARNFFLY